MTKYKIFVSMLQSELENKINNALRMGWELQGGVCCMLVGIGSDGIRTFVFSQAMIKTTKEHGVMNTGSYKPMEQAMNGIIEDFNNAMG